MRQDPEGRCRHTARVQDVRTLLPHTWHCSLGRVLVVLTETPKASTNVLCGSTCGRVWRKANDRDDGDVDRMTTVGWRKGR